MFRLFLRDYHLLLRNEDNPNLLKPYDFNMPHCPHFSGINKVYKKDQINEALKYLDDEDRRLLAMIVSGYKAHEIAKKMNIHNREIKNRSRDLHRQLIRILEKQNNNDF